MCCNTTAFVLVGSSRGVLCAFCARSRREVGRLRQLRPTSTISEGWVERFHKQLSIKLDMRGGRAGEIQIWRDPKLDEATLFDAVIRDRVEHSALFLALVLSSGYRALGILQGRVSEAFRKRYGDARLRVNERSRILRARLQNIPYEQLPGTSDRTSAFDFFVAADDDPIGKLLETDSPGLPRQGRTGSRR